jgi:hypothetical protein
MSSKQINFFFSPEDLPEVSAFLYEKECLVFKREKKTLESPLSYNILKNSDNIFQVYLFKERYKDRIFYEHIDSQGRDYIDILRSYCIEFSIGGFYPYSNKEFHSSRFYYGFKYYDNNKLVQKDEDFISWADGIFKSFKKQFLRSEPQYSSHFISRNFIDWIKVNNAKQTTDGSKFIVR